MARSRRREEITSTVSHSDQPASLMALFALFDSVHAELSGAQPEPPAPEPRPAARSTCAHCSAKLARGARFCHDCGEPAEGD
jgi:hypothetical protein